MGVVLVHDTAPLRLSLAKPIDELMVNGAVS